MLDGVKLRKVDNIDDAGDFFRWLGERRPVLAIDTETTGLEWWTPDFLRLAQFGDGAVGWAISGREWRAVVRSALSDYVGPTVFHNANFDKHALESVGLPLPGGTIHDTMLMHTLCYPLKRHGLKVVGDTLIDRDSSAGGAMLKAHFKRDGVGWATVSEDDPAYWGYAALDVVLTARIAEILHPQMHSTGLYPAYEIELAAQEVMFRAERRGLLLDVPYTETLWQTWEIEINRLAGELQAYGIEKPNANRQITEALKEYENWDPEDWTPTGEAQLDEKVLRALGGDIGPRVLRYRRIRKWRSTYLTRFLEARDSSDRVHPSINTMRAKTGRMSITGPPLQTLPGTKSGAATEIRDCILPEPGHRLCAVDYDGQELRVFASYAGERSFINVITNNPDPHSWVASMVYGKPESEVGKGSMERDIAKNVQYARIYGAGPAKMAQTANNGGLSVTTQDIEHFISLYDQALPAVAAFLKEVDHLGRARLSQDGEAWVRSYNGRRLVVEPDKIYKLVNALVQGSCADLLKRKIVALDSAGYGDFLVLPVHDELIFQFPTDQFDTLAHDVSEIMTETAAFAVPLTVHPSGPLSRWGDVSR